VADAEKVSSLLHLCQLCAPLAV